MSITKICLKCGKEFTKKYKFSKTQWDNAKYCSKSCSGSVNSLCVDRIKLSEILKGRHLSVKSEFKKGVIPWNKGIGTKTSINEKERKSLSYKIWRTAVFKRDNYTCQECGIKSGNGKTIELNPHHIKSFSEYPELRLDIDNGITLCHFCHLNTETFGRRNHKNLIALGTEA